MVRYNPEGAAHETQVPVINSPAKLANATGDALANSSDTRARLDDKIGRLPLTLKAGREMTPDKIGEIQDKLIAMELLRQEDVGNNRGKFGPRTLAACKQANTLPRPPESAVTKVVPALTIEPAPVAVAVSAVEPAPAAVSAGASESVPAHSILTQHFNDLWLTAVKYINWSKEASSFLGLQDIGRQLATLQGSPDYAQLDPAAKTRVDTLAQEVKDACDNLRPIYEATVGQLVDTMIASAVDEASIHLKKGGMWTVVGHYLSSLGKIWSSTIEQSNWAHPAVAMSNAAFNTGVGSVIGAVDSVTRIPVAVGTDILNMVRLAGMAWEAISWTVRVDITQKHGAKFREQVVAQLQGNFDKFNTPNKSPLITPIAPSNTNPSTV